MADSCFATIDDVTALWRAMTPAETERAVALLPVISDTLRWEAEKVGKNLDEMIIHSWSEGGTFENVVRSVTVDVLARALMTSTNTEPTTQFAQSAMGYSVSGTYLVPGGGLFIKNSELARLGLRRQRMGVIDLYGDHDQRHYSDVD